MHGGVCPRNMHARSVQGELSDAHVCHRRDCRPVLTLSQTLLSLRQDCLSGAHVESLLSMLHSGLQKEAC